MKKYAILIIVLAASFCILTPAAHADLAISNSYILTLNRGGSGEGLSQGYFIMTGAYVPPSGSAITATAEQVSGGSHSTTLTHYPSPVFPDEYSYRWNFSASLTGQCRITATDASETVTALTHTLDDVRLLPLAQSLTVSTGSGLMTPTLNWSGFNSGQFTSDENDAYNLRVRARLASNGQTAWDSANMETSVTSYTLLSGTLTPGTDYLLEIMLTHYDNESGNWYIENRSETFIAYSTPSVPIPGAVWLLGSGLLGLVTLRRRFKK